jgi:hypothetical protein
MNYYEGNIPDGAGPDDPHAPRGNMPSRKGARGGSKPKIRQHAAFPCAHAPRPSAIAA